MNQIIEITITAEVPDDKHDLVHEAIVATKAPAQAIADKLAELGLTNIQQTRRPIKRKARATPAPVVPTEATPPAEA